MSDDVEETIVTTRIGINGFGRIGRAFYRIVRDRDDLEVVAVNDLTSPATLAHLLAYDSTYGRLGEVVTCAGQEIRVGGQPLLVSAEADPADLDWAALGVDIVIEATGRFRTRDGAAKHLKAGARKVLISAPGKQVDLTVVLGINQDSYDPLAHDIISNASCTTNCVAPMAKVLHETFGIEQGLMTTIHAYTGDQQLIDAPHKDLRRGRSAAVNIVPTSTGAARATGQVLPALDGRLDGAAIRVPIPDGSLTDLTVLLAVPVTAGEVNAAFHAAAESGPLAGLLRYTNDPIVSSDIIGDPASCVFDAGLTMAAGRLVKVFGWYDNEWGYASRLVDLAAYVAQRGTP
jgi:glyceraldehyde 3-phosphate dehydrogenase (phosphorylating)